MAVISPFWAAASGMILAIFKPVLPATVPNPRNFMDSIISTRCSMVFCVPSHIEVIHLFHGSFLSSPIYLEFSRPGPKMNMLWSILSQSNAL
jgi:hypothetical protein